jgi:hypothetical protein
MLVAKGSPVACSSSGAARRAARATDDLFEAAAREAGAQAVYVGAGMVATVDDLVIQLFSVLKATKKIPEHGSMTPGAWYRLVCARLLELAVDQKKRLWIAVDDLGMDQDGSRSSTPEILAFCNQFALNMQASQYQVRHRHRKANRPSLH